MDSLVRRFSLILLLAVASLTFVGSVGADLAWSPIREDEGVSLWGRPVAGSRYWEYRADALVAQLPDQLWVWLIKTENLPRWLAFIVCSRGSRPSVCCHRVGGNRKTA